MGAMKLPGWFDTTQSDAFAREITEEFARSIPAGAAALPPRVVEQRLPVAMETLGNRAAKYHREHRLGWYRKARFVKTIKERLVEKGHSEALADKVVYSVLLRMARRDDRGTV